uniref:Variant surface glycoprotein 1125.5147 n=1 Tax=Trypanosoma brucei TaxID=5691 RepID=A0A1J0RBL3_9TRYP|nr:variant surface glycoprotein 1125.5147 [Trypanosoma brucei]
MADLKTAIEATESAATLAGAIIGTIDVFAVTKHDSVYCHGNTDGSGDDTAQKAAYGCEYKLNELQASATLLTSDNIDTAGYTKLADSSDGTALTSGTTTKYILAYHAADQSAFSNAGGTYNTLVGGLFGFNTPSKFTRAKYKTVDAKGTRTTAAPKSAAFHAYAALKQSFVAAPVTEGPALITNIVNNGMLKTAIADQLAQRRHEKKTTTHDNEAEQIIKEKYKLEGNTIKELWENIKKSEVADITKTDGSKKQIQQINGDDILLQTITLYNAKALEEISRLEAAAAEKPAPKTNKEKTPTEEQCRQHETTGPCQKEGCEFDETKTPRCFPKPSENKEEKKDKQDAKTTNTTGSNSFIINNAPLLLAVLVL